MLKILTSSEIRQADAYTIENEPVKSINLMERAAAGCVQWITEHFDKKLSFLVFCGTGNNGGDGLAIARMLAGKKYEVQVFIVRQSSKCSDDFLINEKRLKKNRNIKVYNIPSVENIPSSPAFGGAGIIIDALFGTGLNKPVSGLYADVILAMNRSGLRIISIDLPSGLFCEDNSKNNRHAIVRATHTLTFQVPKVALLLRENEEFTGDFTVMDIGLDRDFLASLPSKNIFITRDAIAGLIKPRKKFSHKGNYGHALLIAGSHGMMGAAVLAARACLRSGTGLLTVHVPKCGYAILQSAVPEALAETGGEENFISGTIRTGKYNGVAVGPGIGKNEATAAAIKILIQNTRSPIVFDADAINILSENKTWLSFLPPKCIFTPHPKEFERMACKSSGDYDRLSQQVEFSKKYNCYVVLKGAHTSISGPDGSCWFNSTGNPGMATGGAGDVLTGMILSFLAQGYAPQEACMMGVYLHGLAGDIAAGCLSEEALIAGDIADCIGEAFQCMKEMERKDAL